MPNGLLTLTPSQFPRPVPASALPVAPLTSQPSGDGVNDLLALARDLGICSPIWLRTGSLYAPQPGHLYSILVMPVLPDSTKRHNTYHAATTAVGPSLTLYNTYHSGTLAWHAFALRYLAELDAKRHGVLAPFVEQLCSVPARYSGVLLLGFRQAPGRNEAQVRCPRRLLRAWLLGEVERLPEVQRLLPLPLPQPRPHASARRQVALHAC